jgi:hypothetical protein
LGAADDITADANADLDFYIDKVGDRIDWVLSQMLIF